jgi:hypothetical protein
LHTGWREGRFDDLQPSVPERWTRASQARELDSLLRSILESAGSRPARASSS